MLYRLAGFSMVVLTMYLLSIDSSDQTILLDWRSTSPPPSIGFLLILPDHVPSDTDEGTTKSPGVTPDGCASPSSMHADDHFLTTGCCQLCCAAYPEAVQYVAIQVFSDAILHSRPPDCFHRGGLGCSTADELGERFSTEA